MTQKRESSSLSCCQTAPVVSNSPKSLTVSLTFLTAVKLLVNTAQRFVYPFLPAIARGLGVPLTQAGLLQSARWLAGLTTPLTVRAISERRRRLMLAALSLFAVGAAVTAATNLYLGALAGFVLMGVAKPTFDIAAQAYVADRTPYHRRARYLAVLELTWGGSLLIGAPLAGWLIDRWGWAIPFWVFAALAIGALAAVRRVIEPGAAERAAEKAKPSFGSAARALLVVAGVFSMASELMFVVFGAWLEDGFGLSLLSLGAAGSLVAIAELIGEGSTLAWTDRIGKRRSVIIGLAVAAAAYGLLALTHGSLAGGLTTVAVALAGFEFTIVATLPLASELIPTARARYLAWLMVAMTVGRAIGAAVGPPLFERLGVAGNALAASAANLVGLLVVVAWVAEVRPEPDHST